LYDIKIPTSKKDSKQGDDNVNGRLTISTVAERIGVTAKTIIRWEKAGKIEKPKRDWKGWRFYSEDDLESIRRFVEQVYEF
jgi:hypothetical protein